jgi:WG containing repeat
VRTGIIAAVLLVFATIAVGQNPTQPAKQPASSGRAIPYDPSDGTPCLFDFALGEVPNCVYKDANAELFIAPRFLRDLSFGSHGMAAVRSPSEGWMYVNRQGKVVITGVTESDYWADSFHDGLVRIVKNGKYGFANRKGKVVIAPIYDGALNFENGIAAVCNGCRSKCVDDQCEYHSLVGGRWYRINIKGHYGIVLH